MSINVAPGVCRAFHDEVRGRQVIRLGEVLRVRPADSLARATTRHIAVRLRAAPRSWREKA